jgi:hypothetical protein
MASILAARIIGRRPVNDHLTTPGTEKAASFGGNWVKNGLFWAESAIVVKN